MDKFLETYDLPARKRRSEQIVISNAIEAVIKILPTNESPGADRFTDGLYRKFKEDVVSILILSQKIEQEDTSKLILRGQHYLDIKTKQRHYK